MGSDNVMLNQSQQFWRGRHLFVDYMGSGVAAFSIPGVRLFDVFPLAS